MSETRNRAYLRKVRLKKIAQRREKAHYASGWYDKLVKKGDGILADGNSGVLSFGVNTKTKSRHGYQTYRHRGVYGKAINYTKHDKMQIEKLKYDLNNLPLED